MNAHVVYATITGNNEDIADIISDQLKKHDIEVIETEISQTDAAELQDADICVVCPYTYDEGALPEEGMDFYDDLQDLDLTGKIYGVAGSGDVFYGMTLTKQSMSTVRHLRALRRPRVLRTLKLIWNPWKMTLRRWPNLQMHWLKPLRNSSQTDA